ncbi:carbohydrate-binding domain-containing protein [Microbacterium sp. ZXX196]|uniref:carbohydrate-binding domain-containing protein n=1 Tax=Microbacterium sp. ZXX196 TaxID=2609291 RepID=UPI0012B6D22E|nr:carbohydrate-binding domain-containing protein [Microbacterium sp. ZXX196]MTE24497.1 carbohydrate-binding domain-containing protein [Microbacterium sp. ZXX196]
MTRPTPPRRLRAASGVGLTFALAVAALTGCSALASAEAETGSAAPASSSASASDASSSSDSTTSSSDASTPAGVSEIIEANSDQTVVNDDEWSEADAVDIALDGTTATTSSENVAAAEGSVTITAAGVYRLTGDFDGVIAIDAPEDAQVVLILDGVSIETTDQAAIGVVSADDVAIVLADGSENTVTSTGTYADSADANAAIWADTDLTISGTGALTVEAGANDGITSKDDLVILSGSLEVTAADDGLRGTDSLTVRGGDIVIDAGGDGLLSDQEDDDSQGWVLVEGGTLDVEAGSDGIDGYTDAIVTGGEVTITSEEGIEAGTVAIGGGTISITTTDDGINGSAGTADDTATNDEFAGGMGGGGMTDTGEYVLIAGGEITIDAEGDGLDSNGSLDITGGTTIVLGPTNGGNGALDTNGSLTISGGTLLALDSGGMSGSPSTDSAQAWVATSASGSAGSTVQILAADGTVLYEAEAAKAFGALVFSSADVVAGETYSVTVDGTEVASAATGQALAGGMGGGPR